MSPPEPPVDTPISDEPADRPLWRRLLGFTVSWVIIPGLLVFIIHNFVFQAWYVDGESMEPTLQNGDYLIVSKFDVTWHKLTNSTDKLDLSRGDIVIFQPPTTSSEIHYIKRVIGLPGETVQVKDGKVTIFNAEHPNGFTLDESYVGGIALEGDLKTTVQPGEIFAIGDNRNRNASLDSRIIGPIPINHIVGTASLRLLPTSQFGSLAHPYYSTNTAPSKS